MKTNNIGISYNRNSSKDFVVERNHSEFKKTNGLALTKSKNDSNKLKIDEVDMA